MSVEEKDLARCRWNAELLDLLARRRIVYRKHPQRKHLDKCIVATQWIIRLLEL